MTALRFYLVTRRSAPGATRSAVPSECIYARLVIGGRSRVQNHNTCMCKRNDCSHSRNEQRRIKERRYIHCTRAAHVSLESIHALAELLLVS
jgi:hypothetical protein